MKDKVLAALFGGEFVDPDQFSVVVRTKWGQSVDVVVCDAEPAALLPEDVWDGTPFFVGTIDLSTSTVTEDRTPEVK